MLLDRSQALCRGQTFSGFGFDAYIRKYNSAGNELWTSQFGGGSGAGYASGVAFDDNAVYIAGYTGGGLPGQTGALAAGAHVAKFIHELADIAPGFMLPASFPTAIRYGSLEITSSQLVSILALRLTGNQLEKHC
jgi:hypothetical protein